ncbi:T9SS type A sorting domain-containing protein [Prolixibacteraceae bacterium JC049]|nr:T9SS type A sorting domain-containing protein [Prolixibacteraceae bacterium JC049]
MKRLFSTLILSLVLFLGSNAQAWLKNLPKTNDLQTSPKAESSEVPTKSKTAKELTLKDYQKAFNDYWEPFNVNKKGYYHEKGVKKKAYGWKQFKRWEWDMQGQVDPSTGRFPEKTAQQVYDEYIKLSQTTSSNTANWSEMGPSNSKSDIDNYCNLGRINCIAFHPTDNNTYWIGAPSGGLWVTHDNGDSWQCLTDENNVLGVSDIVIPSNYLTSKTIYIATGDKNAYNNLSIGVLKSTDNGKSWNKTGLSADFNRNRMMVSRLLLDPSDDNIIIAATDRGLFKTTDGGATWDNRLTTINFTDLEFKPGNSSTIYGSTKQGQIYTSNDDGINWTKTFEASNARRVELAVTKANPSIIYAVVGNYDGGLEGIYQSANSGESFTQQLNGSSFNILGYETSEPGGQAFYDLAIAASPSDANTLMVGGIMTWGSKDGGKNWTLINRSNYGGSNPAAIVHVDKHMLKYRSNGDLFECNDGGLSLSKDDGKNWINKTNGMVISQMYRLGVAQTEAGMVMTGLQDNGTKSISSEAWKDVYGGDGMECIIDYTDSKIQYASTQGGGSIIRTKDGWKTTTYVQPTEAGPGTWTTPYIMDPNDHKTLYAGYKEVWKTTNQGDTWEAISNINFSEKILQLAIASSNSSVLFAAQNYSIWKTDNGGRTWKDVTSNLPLINSSIQGIAISHFNEQIVWVALSGYNSDNVFESKDGGETWTNISKGLPQLPAYSIVQNKQSSGENHLYLGTELGVYFKKGNTDWVPYNAGLPNVKIGELEIYYNSDTNNSKLHAATYGRGLWETPLAAPVANLPEVKTISASILSKTSAQFIGEVVNEGTTAVIQRGFVWSTHSNPTLDDNVQSVEAGTGKFTADITNLTAATNYNVRAYATNSSGTSYGTNIICQTDCDPPTSQATDLVIDQINDNSITISWTNNGDPVVVIAKKGAAVNWSPENGFNYKVNSDITKGEDIGAANIAVFSGTASSVTVTNLNDNTIYHFAVYKYNGSEMCYNTENPAIGNATTTGYCAASGGGNLFFNSIKLADIENTDTGYEPYQNFTNISTELEVGKQYTLTVNKELSYYEDIDYGVWIDFNDNKSFEDQGENILCKANCYSIVNFNLEIPANAKLGAHRMRIRTKAVGDDCGTSCGQTLLGEVEDYTVILVDQKLYNATFIIKDSENNFIENASVSLTGCETKQTNADGKVVFSNIAPKDNLEYNITKSGYDNCTGNINIVDKNIEENITLKKSKFNINFTISDQNGSIEGAEVVLDNESKSTNNTGNVNYTKVAGNYNYSVTAAGYHSDSGTINITDKDIDKAIVLSINTSAPLMEDKLLKVYPNPTSGSLTIEGKMLQEAHVYVLDMNGKILISKQSKQTTNKLDLSRYTNGVYLLKIEKNKKTYKRLIVKR